MVFAISEKVRKAMPKWFHNLMKNGATSTPGAPKVEFSLILLILCRVEKSLFFRWRFGASKNRKNGALERQGLETPLRFFAKWGPSRGF